MYRLSSAVTEHRRLVRPSRRTQGSRNPLRALAARNDIMQDFMQAQNDPVAMETNNGELRQHFVATVQLHTNADVLKSLVFCPKFPN